MNFPATIAGGSAAKVHAVARSFVGRLTRLLVISPHCDDAVFACGAVLDSHPGSIVVTVFAGRPSFNDPLTEWDSASGFQQGDDVMGIRRNEDREALTSLNAHPVWLDFCDSQYWHTPSSEEVMEALDSILVAYRPTAVMVPLGLFHSDHILTNEAALLLHRRRKEMAWFFYADALYRQIPGSTEEGLQRCAERGVHLRSVVFPVDTGSSRKGTAVSCYRSQLRALTTPGRPGYADAASEELYWRVTAE